MDLHTRKLEIIKTFLNLQNEDLISRIENLLKKESNAANSESGSLMTSDLSEAFNKRIDQSLKDSQNGKLTEVDALIDEIKVWI